MSESFSSSNIANHEIIDRFIAQNKVSGKIERSNLVAKEILKMKILVVEDDLEQLEPLCAVLSQAGHMTDRITNGKIARSLICDRDYDLLILDWMLPGVSGISLCAQYRQLGKTELITYPF